jgi:cytidylate kinase
MSRIPVIAVDGPSGSGKGVVTSHLAEHYGFHILDSGALYRLVGIAARNDGLALENVDFDESRAAALAAALDVTLRVRSDEAGGDASRVASIQSVRDNLGDLQLSFRRGPGLVADGRDMGTAIFPDADAKIFLTASAEARAERRYNQLKHKDIGVSLHALFQSIQARDERDMSREASPLRPADDALVVDSTDMSIEEVLETVQAFVSQKLNVSG